jgi:hypothetical protein
VSALTRDELLVLLIEECGEVIQAATKCLRFGFTSDHGLGYGKNDLVLAKETGELQAVMEALYLDPDTVYWAKLGKMARARRAKKKYGVGRVE